MNIEKAARSLAKDIWGFSVHDWTHGKSLSPKVEDTFNEMVLEFAANAVAAALGDKVLYEIDKDAGKDWQDFKPMLDIMLRDSALVQVYPEVNK